MSATGEHRVTFYGAAQEVTGSCHLLESGGRRYLLDCGMHQGEDRAEDDFAFDAAGIDAVILSHAHLDHSGRLPLLVRRGFAGTIYCTTGTYALLKILLEDAVGLYLRDLEYKNLRRKRAGKPLLRPAYEQKDVARVLRLCQTLDYRETFAVSDECQLTFFDAGHILGSSIVRLRLGRGEAAKTLVFSGDLGNPETSLMNDPETLDEADLVLLEGTYGNRDHRSFSETVAEFEQVLEDAKADNGSILIPSFAVGRTQEVLFQLGQLYHQGKLQGWQVFLDSPMAHAVTEVYDRLREQWNVEDSEVMRRYRGETLAKFLPCLRITESVEESMAINRIKSGAIVIAGSGMCTGGRIRHHLKHRLWRSNTHLVFIGYQARGTLGRILVDGVKNIKMFGQEFYVKAQIHTLGGFSAHAGKTQLVDWACAFKNRPRFYLVHGEPEPLQALTEALRARQLDVTPAEKGSTVSL